MRKIFSYSVLRFRPSYLLEEQINVGLLFVFPETQQVIFLYPNDLQRVQLFYKKADLLMLEKYLESFKEKAISLSGASFDEKDIHRNFIPLDANSLYFSPHKSGHYSDINTILDYYKKQYFSEYE